MQKMTITLPDGSAKEFPRGATGLEIAESIGKRLAQDALAIKIGGELKDVFLPLEKSAPIRIVTWKDKEGMEVFRHSTAHLLAQAVLRLFPAAKLAIGPAIANGFFFGIPVAAGKHEVRLQITYGSLLADSWKRLVTKEDSWLL